MGMSTLKTWYLSSFFAKKEQTLPAVLVLTAILLIMAPVFAVDAQITLNSPPQGAYVNTSSVNHSFTVAGANESYGCILYYGEVQYGSNGSVLNNTVSTIESATVTEGNYTWKVNCTSLNDTGTSDERQITIDQAPPVLVVSSPESKTYNVSSVGLNYTVTDSVSTVSCEYSLDGNSNQALIGCQNAVLDLPDGNHSVTVYAIDSAGNINSVSVSDISVNTSTPSEQPVEPQLTITSPANGATLTSKQIEISYNSTDPNFDHTEISLVAENGTTVASTNRTVNGTETISLSAPEDGTYSIAATMYNTSLQPSGIAGVTGIIIVTATPPVEPQLTITSPANGATLTSKQITIAYISIDSSFNKTEFALVDNSGANVSLATGLTNGTGTILLTAPADGTYNITVVMYNSTGVSKTADVLNIVIHTSTSGGGSSGGSTGGGSGRRTISSGGGGSGVPSFWSSTKIADENSFAKGYSITLQAKQRIKVMTKNQTHYIGIISLTDRSAVINVSSTPQQFILYEGSEQKVDVDNDTYYEVYMKLDSVNSTQAGLTIKEIYEKIVPPAPPVKNETRNVSVIEPPPVQKPICMADEKRCSGNELQECVSGAWQTNEICKDGCDSNRAKCLIPAEEKKDQFTYIPTAIFVIALLVGAYVLVKFAGPKVTRSSFFAGELTYNQNLQEKIKLIEARINRLERHGNNVRKMRVVFEDIEKDIESGLHNIAEGRLEALNREIEFLEIV